MDRLPPIDPTALVAPSPSYENTLATLTEAKKGAARLLGCFRAGDANDPETYTAAVIAVLNRYPIEVIREVTEPATGLPSISKWLPTISEIRNECDVLVGRIETRARLDRELAEQFEARQTLQITDGRQRPTYEELRRQCHEVGLMIGPKGSRMPPIDPVSVQKKYGISAAQWDAILNAKK